MKLDFTSLIIDQFKSFTGAPHELDLASYGPGLHFVRGKNLIEPRLGSNGAAKSSLWDALCWCLYGRTPAGLRNPDIQARFGEKATSVKLWVRVDNVSALITRTTHPNRLLIDEEAVGQETVDEFVRLDFDTFTNTILLGQGRPLFFDLTPKAKLDLFGTVLNLDRWDARSRMSSDAATVLEATEAELASGLQVTEGQLDQIATLLEQALAAWKTWRDVQDAQVEQTKASIVALKEEREEKERKRGGFDLQYDGAATELKAAQENSRRLAAAGEKLILELSPLSTSKGVLEAQQQELASDPAGLGTDTNCPTCGQPLHGTKLSKYKAELQRKFRECSTNLRRVEALHAALTAKITTNQNKLAGSRVAEREFQRKAEDARDAQDRLVPEIARLTALINQRTADVKAGAKAANPYTSQIAELRATKKELELTHKETSARTTKLGEQIERTRFWVKGFKEVGLYELEDVLQELELTTNAAAEEVGLVDWQITYSVERETKAGTIQRGLNVFIQGPQDKSPVRWESWSGGESQRLRLIGALALSEVLLSRAGVEPTMEILDEPTHWLSVEGVQDLCEYLADRAQTLQRQIWYVDHMAVESSRFTSTLTVIKDENGSYLDSEEEK